MPALALRRLTIDLGQGREPQSRWLGRPDHTVNHIYDYLQYQGGCL